MKSMRVIIFSIVLFTLSIGLAYFIYLGYFTRFWQDDWCYNADFQRLGLIGTLKGYNYITTYASNRFSLTLFSGFLYYLGVVGVQILPGIVIAGLLGTNYWFLINMMKIFNRQYSKIFVLIIAMSIVFFTIYLAPDRFQSFYWRSAILPYTFPLIFFILLAAIITSRIVNPSKKLKWLIPVIVIISFLGSGFSEAGGAFFFTGLAILLLLIYWQKALFTKNILKELISSIVLGLLSSLSALVLMLLSPANTLRQISYSEPSSFIETITLSIKFGIIFIIDSLKSYPLPHLIFFILIFSASFLVYKQNNHRAESFISMAKKQLFILVISTSLTIALHAPSAYIEGNPPADRTLIISRWIVLLGLSAIAWVIAEYLATLLKSNVFNTVMLIFLVLSNLYLLRAIYQTFDYHQSRFEKIATVWDERDESIRSQKEDGVEIIHVKAIDSQFLGGGVLEWYPEPNWVNLCAADYYQVKEIRATLDW